MNDAVIELTQQLIEKKSISPNDAGCQPLLIARLAAIGFHIEPMHFADTENFYAWRGDVNSGKTLLFAGHTDVVSAGDIKQWHYPPFAATLEGDHLYGRGAADMKGALAAMVVAVERFVASHAEYQGRIAFLITSDEEAHFINGTIKVVERLMARNEKIDYCLIGEPSSSQRIGDTIKNGRRGSINATLTILGVQGHVAYPQFAENPVHKALSVLAELVNIQWDAGNQFFQPTCLQITSVSTSTNAENMVPGQFFVQFNLRYSSELSEAQIKQQVHQLLDRHQLQYRIEWRLSGVPFLTKPAELIDATRNAIKQCVNITPTLSTSGGTSDGRFIAKMGCQIVELGVVNASMHKANECVNIHELKQLSQIYQQIMQELLL